MKREIIGMTVLTTVSMLLLLGVAYGKYPAVQLMCAVMVLPISGFGLVVILEMKNRRTAPKGKGGRKG